jgi:hypothetical protein
MKEVLVIAIAVMLCGCATPYGKYGLAGGYTDVRIDENTFSISVDNNGYTSQQTTSMHALYRAAELTVENGFDYFIIATGASNPKSGVMALPGSSTSNTTISGYGPSASARTTTTYGPTMFVPVVFPNAAMVIKSFRGTKPDNVSNAYDARTVMKYVGPQIGVEKQR